MVCSTASLSPIVAISLATLSCVVAITLSKERQKRQEEKINHLSQQVEKLSEDVDIYRRAIESKLQEFTYKLECFSCDRTTEYPEDIARKIEDNQRAIETLSGALQRISSGDYKPRGDRYWPVERRASKSDPRES